MMIWAFGILGIYFFTSLYLQQTLGFSPVKAGLAFVPMALCVAVFAVIAPRVQAWAGAHRTVAFGMLLMVAGLVLFARLGLNVTYPALLPGFMLFGAGAGLMNVPLTNATMAATPAARAGIASALLNASREVAGLLGITVIGAILSTRRAAALRSGADQAHAFLTGYHTGLLVTIALMAAGVVVSYLTLRPRRTPSSEPTAVITVPGELEAIGESLGELVIPDYPTNNPGSRTGMTAGSGVGAVMTTVGIIGSGMIGGTVARLSVAAGYQVVVSNSRGPETLAELAAELGPLATAGTAEQAAEAGDLVVVSVPVKAFAEISVKPLAGKPVLDTGNYYPQRDGHLAELDTGALTSSGLLQRDLPDAQVVKVFNNIFFKHLASLARPHGAEDRSALPIAGDSAAAKAAVTAFLDSIGYDAVDAGPIADSWRQEPGTPVYGTPYGPFSDEAGTPAPAARILVAATAIHVAPPGVTGRAATRLADPHHLAAGEAQLRAHAAGRGDAAVGDVDRAVGPGREAGRVEQLAHPEVGAVAPPVDAYHVTGRVGPLALVQPAGLELGGVERAVPAEAAALHGGQASSPDLSSVARHDPPDAGVPRAVVAAQQLSDVQRAVRPAGQAGRHRVALRPLRDPEERQHLDRAAPPHLNQDIGSRVDHVDVAARVEHRVGVGVREVLGRELDPGGRPRPVLVTHVGQGPDGM